MREEIEFFTLKIMLKEPLLLS
jgi:hypothetical protein